ncbi:MAG: hypothetical protein D4R79_08515, partial [Comamonadaceae bacterium]
MSSAIATDTAAGTRILTLTAAGAININAAIGNTTGTLNLTLNSTNGGISGAGAISGTGTTTFNVASAAGSGIYSGIISKTTLTKSGLGMLTLSGANTYTGITTVSAGTLRITDNAALGSALSVSTDHTVVSANATLDLQGATLLYENVTLNGGTLKASTSSFINGNIILGAATSYFDADASATLSVGNGSGGIISGATKNIEKGSGTGIVSLGSANTFTGTTKVNGGTLKITNIDALGTTGTTVNTGGTLNLATGGTVTEPVTLNGGTLTSLNSNDTLSGTVTLQIDSTVDAGSGRTLTLNGDISGASKNLIKGTGAGTVSLNVSNTYTGTTTINGGTLRIWSAPGALGGVGTTVNSGGTLDLYGLPSGLTLTTETITLNGGTLTNTSSATSTTISNPVVLSAQSTVDAGSGATLNLSGVISGAGMNLVKGVNNTSTGTVTLSGANTYTGTTTVNYGTLRIDHASALGTSGTTVNTGASLDVYGITLSDEPITLAGGTLKASHATVDSSISSPITLSAGSIINVVTTGRTLTISSIIDDGAGSFGIGKTGPGILALTNANTYDGTTTVGAGTIKTSNAAALGSTTGGTTINSTGTLDLGTTAINAETITITNGTLTVGGNQNLTGALVLNGTANNINITAGTLTVDNPVTGAYAFTKQGAGTLLLNATNTFCTSCTSATNSGFAVTAGTLRSGAIGAIPSSVMSADVSVGTWDLNGFDATVGGGTAGGITGSGGFISLGGATLTIDTKAAPSAFTSIISGAGNIVKAGIGTQQFGGANTYTGTTTVSAGTLQVNTVNGLGATGSGAETIVQSGASLTYGFTDSIAENLTLNGGTLKIPNFYSPTQTGTITLGANSAVDVNSGRTLTVSGNVSGSYNLNKTSTGTLILSGTNSYSTTSVAAGVLELDAQSAVGTGGFTLAASTTLKTIANIDLGTQAITLNGAATFDVASATTLTLGGNISGGGGITKTSNGTSLLSGSNSYTGLTTVSAGTLKLGSTTALGTAAAGTSITSGATLDLNGFTLSTGEALTINGTGISGTAGALTNSSVTAASYSGLITLAGASTINASTGSIMLTNAGTITGAFGLTLDGASTGSSLDSIIGTGVGTLTKQGSGAWVLSGANTYTGSTTLNAGTLSISADNNLGAAPVTVTPGKLVINGSATLASTATFALSSNRGMSFGTGANAGLNVASGTTLTYNGIIASTTAGLKKIGDGTLSLGGANLFTGAVALDAGTLVATNATALGTIAGGVTVASPATLEVQGVAIGAEALTLNGTLKGTGTTSSFAGAITLGANLSIDTANGTIFTLSGIIADGASTYGLTKTGAGTLVLTGSNTYDGITALNGGTLKISGSGTLGSTSAGTTVASGTTLDLSAGTRESLSINGGTIKTGGTSGSVVLEAGGATIEIASGLGNYSGVISGSGGITKIGAGTFVFGGSTTNTYTGATVINAGTVKIGANNISLAGSAFTVATSTFLDITQFNTTLGSIAGGGSILLSDRTLTVGADNSSTTFSGTISGATVFGGGAGKLVKSGAGTLTLSGNNAYDGITTINAGTLAVTSNNALGNYLATNNGTSAVDHRTYVNAGATLDFNNVNYSSAEAVVLNGGTLKTSSGTSSFTGTVTLSANSMIDVSGTLLTLSGVINDSTSTFGLTKTGSGKAVLSASNTYDGSTSINGGALSIGALANIGTGNLALGGGTLEATNDLNLGSRTVTLTADSTLNAASTKTISGGVFSASGRNLTLAGGGNFTLTSTSNDFGTVTTASATTVALVDTNDLTLGATTVSSLNAQAGAGGGTPGAGNLILNGAISASLAGANANAVVLATGNGSSVFTNNVGANAITLSGSGSPRWLVYVNDPYTAGNTFGGLKSYNDGIFGKVYTGYTGTAYAPGSVTETGNRYLIRVPSSVSSATTVTVNTLDNSKTYGEALTLTESGYTISYSAGTVSLPEFSEGRPSWIIGTAGLTSGGTVAGATVIGGTSGTALYPVNVSGLSSNDVAKTIRYNLGNIIIGARPLTLSTTAGSVQSREYDGTTNATFAVAPSFTLGNIFNSDSVSLIGTGTVSFVDKNVGAAKATTWGGLTSNNANYTLPTSLPTFTGGITARTLTLSATAQDKTYDQSATATLTGLTGDRKIGGDDLSYSAASASFASANVARNGNAVIAQNVTVSGLALAGVDAGNYSLSSTGATTTATINPIALSLTGATGTKQYDGSTVLSAPTFTFDATGKLSGDTVTAVSGSATFDSRHVGTGKTLTATLGSLTLTGAQGGNYSLGSGTYDGSGDITAKPVTLALGGVTRAYDGSLSYDAGASVLTTLSSQLVAGDTVTAATGTYDNANAGTGRTVTFNSATLSDGNGGNNYSVALGAGSNNSAITKANLTLSTSDVTRAYNGGLTAAGTATVVAGTLYTNAGNSNVQDTISGGTFAFADKDAGSNKTVTASGVTVTDGNAGGNYNITYTHNTTSTINPYAVSLTGTRAYDGTTDVAAGVLTLGALVGSETLALSGTGSVADKHVANGKAVTIASLSLGSGSNGGAASNYTFTGGTQTVDVTTASLTLSTGNVSKTYDGDATAAGAAATVSSGTLFGSDSISGGSFAFVGANAGAGNKGVTVTGVTLSDDNSGGNYAVTYASNTTSTINRYAVSLSGTRGYDGTANVGAGIFTLGTLVGVEALTLTGTGTVASKNIGTGKAVTLGSLALVDDTGLASNYTFTGGTQTAGITQATLSVTAPVVT